MHAPTHTTHTQTLQPKVVIGLSLHSVCSIYAFKPLMWCAWMLVYILKKRKAKKNKFVISFTKLIASCSFYPTHPSLSHRKIHNAIPFSSKKEGETIIVFLLLHTGISTDIFPNPSGVSIS